MASVQDQIELLFSQKGLEGLLSAFGRITSASEETVKAVQDIDGRVQSLTKDLKNMYNPGEGAGNLFSNDIKNLEHYRSVIQSIAKETKEKLLVGDIGTEDYIAVGQQLKELERRINQIQKAAESGAAAMTRLSGAGTLKFTQSGDAIFSPNLEGQYSKIVGKSEALRTSLENQKMSIDSAKARYKELEAELARIVQSFNNLRGIGKLTEESWARHEQAVIRVRTEMDRTKQEINSLSNTWYRAIGQLPSFDAISGKGFENLPKVFKNAGVAEAIPLFEKLSKQKIAPQEALGELQKIQNKLLDLMTSVDAGTPAYKRYSAALLAISPAMRDVTAAAQQQKSAMESAAGATSPAQRALLELHSITKTLPAQLQGIAGSVTKTFKEFSQTGDIDIAKKKFEEYKIQLDSITKLPVNANNKGLIDSATQTLAYIETMEKAVDKYANSRAKLNAASINETNSLSALKAPSASLPTGVQSGLTKIAGIYEKAQSGALSYGAAVEKIEKIQQKFASQLNAVQDPVLMKKLRQEIEKVNPYLQNLVGNLKQAKATQDQFTASSNKTSQGILSLGESFELAAFKIIRYRISYLAMAKAAETLRGTVDEVTKVNYELAQLAKVVDPGIYSLRELEKTAVSMSIQFGLTTEEVLKSMNTWARVGLEGVALNKAVEATLLGVNAVGVTTEEMTNALTAAMFTYGVQVEDLTKTISAWFAVSNAFPLSAQDIVGALNNVGSAAKEVGIDLNELSGYVAAINAVTRKSGVAIGQSLKTMLARFVRPETETLLAQVGVSLRDSETSFRDVDEVLDDLAGTWDNLTEKMRVNIATQVGGIRRYVDFLALMDQYAIKQRAVGIAMTANNEATRAQKIEMDTLKKRFDVLGASFGKLKLLVGEGLFAALQTSIASLTTFVNALTSAEDKFKIFSGAIVLVANAIKGAMMAIASVGIIYTAIKAWQLYGVTLIATAKFVQNSTFYFNQLSSRIFAFLASSSNWKAMGLAIWNAGKSLLGIGVASKVAAGGLTVLKTAFSTLLPQLAIAAAAFTALNYIIDWISGSSAKSAQGMLQFEMPNKQDFEDTISAIQGYQKQIDALGAMDSRVESLVTKFRDVTMTSGEMADALNSLSAFSDTYAKDNYAIAASLEQIRASAIVATNAGQSLTEEQKKYARTLAESNVGATSFKDTVIQQMYASRLYDKELQGVIASQEELNTYVEDGKSSFYNYTQAIADGIQANKDYQASVEALKISLQLQKNAATATFKQQYASVQKEVPKISAQLDALTKLYNNVQLAPTNVAASTIDIPSVNSATFLSSIDTMINEAKYKLAQGRNEISLLNLNEQDTENITGGFSNIEKEIDKLSELKAKVLDARIAYAELGDSASKNALDLAILAANKQAQVLTKTFETLGNSTVISEQNKQLRDVSTALQLVNRYGIIQENKEPVMLFNEEEIKKLEKLREEGLEIKLKLEGVNFVAQSFKMVESLAAAGFSTESRYAEAITSAKNALMDYFKIMNQYDLELKIIDSSVNKARASQQKLNDILADSKGVNVEELRKRIKAQGLDSLFVNLETTDEAAIKRVASVLEGEIARLEDKKVKVQVVIAGNEIAPDALRETEKTIAALNAKQRRIELFKNMTNDIIQAENKIDELKAKINVFDSEVASDKALSEALGKPYNEAQERASALFDFVKAQSDEIEKRKIKINLASTEAELSKLMEIKAVVDSLAGNETALVDAMRSIYAKAHDGDTTGFDEEQLSNTNKLASAAREMSKELEVQITNKKIELMIQEALYNRANDTLNVHKDQYDELLKYTLLTKETESRQKAIEDIIKRQVDAISGLALASSEIANIKIKATLTGDSEKTILEASLANTKKRFDEIIDNYTKALGEVQFTESGISYLEQQLSTYEALEKSGQQLTKTEQDSVLVYRNKLAELKGTLSAQQLGLELANANLKNAKDLEAAYKEGYNILQDRLNIESRINTAFSIRQKLSAEALSFAGEVGIKEQKMLEIKKKLLDENYKIEMATILLTNTNSTDKDNKLRAAANKYQEEMNELKMEELRISQQIQAALSAAQIGQDIVDGLKSAFNIDTLGNAERSAELRKEEVELEYQLQQARASGDSNSAKSLEDRIDKVRRELKDVGTWYGQIGKSIEQGGIAIIQAYQKRLADNFVDSIMNISFGTETLDYKIGKAIEQSVTGVMIPEQTRMLDAYLNLQTDKFKVHVDGMGQVLRAHVESLGYVYAQIGETAADGTPNASAGLELIGPKESKQLTEIEKTIISSSRFLAHSIGMSLAIELGRNIGGSSKGAAFGGELGNLLGVSIGTQLTKASSLLLQTLVPGLGGILGSAFGGILGGILGGDDEKPDIEDNTSAIMSNTEALRANTDALSQLDASVLNAPSTFVQPLATSRTGSNVQYSIVINAANANAKDVAIEVQRVIERDYERESSVSSTNRRYTI